MWKCKSCGEAKVYEPEKPGLCDYCLDSYFTCPHCGAYIPPSYVEKNGKICEECVPNLYATSKIIFLHVPVEKSLVYKAVQPKESEPLAPEGGRYVELD